MSGYKTIAAYVPDAARAERVFSVASALASQHGAHLSGYFVMPPELVTSVFGVGRQLIAAGRNALREQGQAVAERFEAAGATRQIRKDWRLVDAGRQTVPQTLAAHLRHADLVVVSQRSAEWEDSMLLEFPEEIALQSGRPTLVVPNVGTFGTVGRRVVVAWNDRREAARAVFDALPVLEAADEVKLVWVNPDEEEKFQGDLPTADIAQALARHGVKCTSSVAYGTDQSVGDILLNECSDYGADLLVMGAYGHARLREFVVGGATRQILKTMTIPVMLSH